MFAKGMRKFLYAGALLALAPIVACADDKAPAETIAAPKAPATNTYKVRVLECVAEPCEYTRTCYKPVTKEETYTAYRCEIIPETVTKTVTCYKRVCETVMETRCVTKRIPCYEERTEMVTRCKFVQVTEMQERTVRGGHWECCTVPAGQSVCDRLCGRCADPCATKTVKHWVSECHKECVPVCKTKVVKECVPVCRKICTYKCVSETVQVPVTKVRCIPETKQVTCTVCKKVMIPYQAKRCVTTCEAVNEVVKGTKMVPKWVEKEVACAPAPVCAPAPCADTCGAASGCCGRGLLTGLKNRCGNRGGCCN
jgi:hypothetical protein